MKIKGADNQDVVENTPRTLPRDHVTFGHYRCCATSGCAHPREPRRGTSDLLSPPVAMLLLLRKKEGKAGHAQNLLPVRTTSSHVTDVTSGQKALLGRIWRNRLRMRRTYFRSGPLPARVTSCHVTDVPSGHVTGVPSGHVISGSTTSQHHLKCDFVRTYILLTCIDQFVGIDEEMVK